MLKGTHWEKGCEWVWTRRKQVIYSSQTFGDFCGCYIPHDLCTMTCVSWPDSGLHWNHLFTTSLFLHHTFSFVHTFVFAFLHNWEINDFKINPVNPWRTLDVLRIQETVYHSDRPLGLLCVFCTQCAHVWVNERWWARGFESVLVAHNYTVQYSFRYLPMWRVTAWTEPWHGAKVMLYSVDNC